MKRITKNSIMLMALLLPSFAFAANLFDVSSGDISLRLLGAIFGSLMDSTGGGGMSADPLLGGIKVFNGGCLIIGGILAAYTILAGTLNTAHDGEMLGKKFSSVWIPVRYSVGTALVLPVVGGGYCVMQAIVMWLVIQGIGLADGVWGEFVKNPTSAANTTSLASRDDVIDIAKAAFDDSMCYKSYAKAISDSSSVLKWGKYSYSKNKTSQGWVYGDSSSPTRINGCGQINYPQDTLFTTSNRDATSSNLAQDSTFVNNTPTTNSGYLGDLGTIFAPMDITPIQQAHNAQLDILVDNMDKLAGTVIDSATDGGGVSLTPDQAAADYALIEKAADDYAKGIKAAADGLSTGDAFKKVADTAGNQGWMLAGAWFTRIVQMNDRINKAVHSTPTNDPSMGPALDRVVFSDAEKYRDGAAQVLAYDKRAGILARAGSFLSQSNEQTVNGNTGGVFNFVTNPLKWLESKMTQALTSVDLYQLKNDSRHPLIIANELGNRLLYVSTILIGVLSAGVAAAAKVLNIGSDMLGPALQVLGWLVDLPIKLLFGVGMGTAFVLPNMPFIIWVGCITGWVLLVIEAIIAAPLWAIMHLHPNGDDLTGRGGNGYSLVLSLLLRPVLMVFGMEAAIVISSVIGEFINKTFFEVFAQSTGSFTGISAVTALAMGTMVYFIVMFTFLKKCFGIIHQLPDQLLQWIGGGGSQLGQFANEFSHSAERAGSAGAGAAGWAAGGASLSNKLAGDRLLGKQRSLKDEKQASIKRAGDKLDKQLGEGTGLQMQSFPSMRHDGSWSGMNRAEKNVSAFTNAQLGVAGTDPEFGKQEFFDRFAQSEANDHAAYGGDAALAAHTIGSELMERNIQNHPNGDFLSRAVSRMEAPGGKSLMNGADMKSATDTLATLKSKLNDTQANDLLGKAMQANKHGAALVREVKNLYKTEFKERETPPTSPSGGINGESQG